MSCLQTTHKHTRLSIASTTESPILGWWDCTVGYCMSEHETERLEHMCTRNAPFYQLFYRLIRWHSPVAVAGVYLLWNIHFFDPRVVQFQTFLWLNLCTFNNGVMNGWKNKTISIGPLNKYQQSLKKKKSICESAISQTVIINGIT